MKIRIAAVTDTGVVRDHNEDNHLVSLDLHIGQWFPSPPENGTGQELGRAGALLAVADGMGGMNAGEVAARIAVEKLQEIAPSFPQIAAPDLPTVMKHSFMDVNQAIVTHSQQNPATEGMGTTLIYAWIVNGLAHIAWVGDSRAYLFRPSAATGNRLQRLSKDHSLVQQWINEGKMTDEQAFYHPQNNIVTQSLGDPDNHPEADYVIERLSDGDMLILCSDGLNGMLLDSQIEDILLRFVGRPWEAARALTNAAIDEGGHDNITVAIAQIGHPRAVVNAHEQAQPYERVSRNTLGDGAAIKINHAAANVRPESASFPKRKDEMRNIWIIIGAVLTVALGLGVTAWLGLFTSEPPMKESTKVDESNTFKTQSPTKSEQEVPVDPGRGHTPLPPIGGNNNGTTPMDSEPTQGSNNTTTIDPRQRLENQARNLPAGSIPDDNAQNSNSVTPSNKKEDLLTPIQRKDTTKQSKQGGNSFIITKKSKTPEEIAKEIKKEKLEAKKDTTKKAGGGS